MLATPYRSTDVRPDATPLRMSWWGLAMSLLAAGFMGTLAYALFRYVANGWLGYAIAGVVALLAGALVRSIGSDRVGACPRCGTTVEVSGDAQGYACPSCKTFVERDRGQLIVTPNNRVAALARFGVEYDESTVAHHPVAHHPVAHHPVAPYPVLPDCCCVCGAATARRIPTRIRHTTVDVPYCAEHTRGIAVDPKRPVVWFRSYAYAQRVAEASKGRLIATNRPSSRGDSRWLGFGLGLVMAGGAAAAYWGLAALEREGYEIVPTSPKGLVLWICLKLLGRLWVTAILVTLAAAFFGMFIGSFKPRRA